jgi:hypothetical protein
MSSFEPLVFSGVQPTGNLTLGNYLGAIKKFVALQDTHNCIYCVVDLHALTVNPSPQELIDGTRAIAAAFSPPASTRSSISFSTRAVCISMPNWPGSSTAWRAWAG